MPNLTPLDPSATTAQIEAWLVENHREILADPETPEAVRVATEAAVQSAIARYTLDKMKNDPEWAKRFTAMVGEAVWHRVHDGHTSETNPGCACLDGE